ncbi:hypothetical protein [Lactococcus garvieae]|uniref:hypothetical protein n=1 Tax=Lactococcus garvieae TaxID=1363 RepID=UPI00398ED5B3
MNYIAFGLGIIFIIWGTIRIKYDYKRNKASNNIIGLILSGEASGIGQFLSGVFFIIIGIFVTLFN